MSLTDKQIAFRRTGITATDMRVLAGVDPYGRTEHDVWASKVLGTDDFTPTEATELGEELEPILVPRLAKKVGLHALRSDPQLLTRAHPDKPTHIATPDALLAPTRLHDPEALAQVKVCGLYAAGHWGHPKEGPDGVPEHVLVQVAWEMHVYRLPVEFVGALIGTELRAYRLELTPDIARLIEALEETADRWWQDHVVRNRPPAIDGTEGSRRMLRGLFPKVIAGCIPADDQAEALAADYFARKAAVAEAEQALEATRQLLITACGSAEGILGEGWRLYLRERDGYTVQPSPYTVPAQRHFDLRRVGDKPGPKKAAARPRKRATEAA